MRGPPGFALPAALAAIVLIAALATAALFASSQESLATRWDILDQQASAYAERSALQAIAGWNCGACDDMTRGGVLGEIPAPDPPLESTVFITKLDSALYLVVGEGRVTSAGAIRIRRRVAITVRTARDSLGVPRAFPLHPHSWSAVYGM